MRYILNKCEDMVFDTIQDDEIYPGSICNMLNSFESKLKTRELQIEKLGETIAMFKDKINKLEENLKFSKKAFIVFAEIADEVENDLRADLKREQECVDKYAGNDLFEHVMFTNDPNDLGGYVSLEEYGGKLARETQRRRRRRE